jgi:hypothetical protein
MGFSNLAIFIVSQDHIGVARALRLPGDGRAVGIATGRER